MTPTLCEKCQQPLNVGDFPFCPHGRTVANVIGDDIPGGVWIENLGDQPMQFFSKKAIAEEADRRGLRMTDKWAGPGDRHLSNWAAGIDAQTLANVTELLTRRERRAAETTAKCETLQTSVRELQQWSDL